MRRSRMAALVCSFLIAEPETWLSCKRDACHWSTCGGGEVGRRQGCSVGFVTDVVCWQSASGDKVCGCWGHLAIMLTVEGSPLWG